LTLADTRATNPHGGPARVTATRYARNPDLDSRFSQPRLSILICGADRPQALAPAPDCPQFWQHLYKSINPNLSTWGAPNGRNFHALFHVSSLELHESIDHVGQAAAIQLMSAAAWRANFGAIPRALASAPSRFALLSRW